MHSSVKKIDSGDRNPSNSSGTIRDRLILGADSGVDIPSDDQSSKVPDVAFTSIRARLQDAVQRREDGTTPREGTEVIKRVRIVEASELDVPLIQNIYNSLLYDRSIFDELSDVEKRKDEQYLRARLKILASGGELFPISSDEWKRRINEERLQLVLDKEDKVIGVNSYVFPDSDESRERILTRINQITFRDKAHTRWFNQIEETNASQVFMLNDTFFLPESGKGLLQETYRQMVIYEMEKNPGLINHENLVNWFIYYWVNSFVNVYHSKKENESPPFLVPPLNRASVMSTIRAGGSNIGYTSTDEYTKLKLPSLVPGENYISPRTGNPIIINRPYVDVMIPAGNFLSN